MDINMDINMDIIMDTSNNAETTDKSEYSLLVF